MTRPDAPGPLEGIAVIGMAGRFPGANSVDRFWQNLRDGVDCISYFSHAELLASGIDPARLGDPDYVRAGGVVEDIELFDARFFGYTPREAELMDPQHRLFLECAWEALEHAGYDSERYKGTIGVYAGAGISTYLLHNLASRSDLAGPVSGLQAVTANDKDHVPTRVSFKLNLRGPSVSVQTTCSTSLVAVHLACQSLLTGECDIALAGGVLLDVPQKAGYLYQPEGIRSPDGRCRAFDANARGTVGGNGVAIVVLMRLAEAVAERAHIHAVIRGSAINNDGASKMGYTAPSVDGQAEVIAMAQAMAGVEPETVSYIETHGTGTVLGDRIEIAALKQVFRSRTHKSRSCAIGSVKTNVGHLDAAAGAAGLIKTVLALEHRLLPPSLHCETPHPELADSPFYVNTTLSPWESGETRRRAGVSSFGIGGTNAHVVLEEAPPRHASGESRPWQLLVISAKTSTALESATSNLREHFARHPDRSLADVAYTLQVGRRRFGHRRMVVCRDLHDALTALQPPDPERVVTHLEDSTDRAVAFMFPGQGAQYPNMGLGLYQAEATFRHHVDHCADLLRGHLGIDLREILYPRSDMMDAATQQLGRTFITQPALFVVEYALAQLWMQWGVRPDAMIGHSVGEYVAACLAGVFSLEDAVRVVATRARLVQDLPGGAMLAVSLPVDAVEPQLDHRLSVAALNDPGSCVVSGPAAAIARLETQLAERGVVGRRLHTSHAFHSSMMDAVLGAFAEQVSTVTLNPPRIPYLSNVTGTWITAAEATDPGYWARHLRHPVRFEPGVRELVRESDRILLEVGPGHTLSTFARRIAPERSGQIASSMRHPHDPRSDVAVLLESLGRLWLWGTPVDWSGVHAPERRRRLPLPTYPFERERYWIEPRVPRNTTTRGSRQKLPDVADWFHLPSWKRSVPSPAPGLERLRARRSFWLLFTDDGNLGTQLVKRLEHLGQDVLVVRAGEEFARLGAGAYAINPRRRADYDALVSDLSARRTLPESIVHLWGVRPHDEPGSDVERLERAQELGFYSLLLLAQAIGHRQILDPLQIAVLTSNVHEVTGEEALCPERATALAPCKVIPQEFPNITCRSIDLGAPPSGGWTTEDAERVLVELASPIRDVAVAYRGRHRWVQTFEPLHLDGSDGRPSRLRRGGVYLITGGLGGVGLETARYLARQLRAKLVLVGRSSVPAREAWHDWLAAHDGQDAVSHTIHELQALEELGADVMIARADVTDPDQMGAVIREADRRFGAIHGVIHAAGAAQSFHTIQDAARIECERHLRPKLHGSLVLERLLQGRDLDFCLMQSSLAAILGAVGSVAYTAAHVFMDCFVAKRNRTGSTAWLSVNWDNWSTWKEAGRAPQLNDADLLMTSEEAAQALGRLLSAGSLGQVIVSTGDLQARIDRWIHRAFLEDGDRAGTADPVSLHRRPEIKDAYVPPRDSTERALAEIVGHVLGLERVGVHDNFFELGGDSVAGIQIVAKANQAGLRVTVKEIFECQTIAKLATAAGAGRGDQSVESPARPIPLTPISPQAGTYTPSDFPGAKLTQKALDEFLARVGHSRARTGR